MRTIEIDLTEDDVNYHLAKVAFKGETLEWVFPTDDGEDINIKFVPYADEYEEEEEDEE